MRSACALAALAAALLAASTGAAATAPAGGYAQEAALARAITSEGITYAGLHKAIDRARCLGLRLYGVQRSGPLDAFHRMRCDLTDADRHVYEAQVLIVRASSSGFSWEIVWGRRRV
jgi:hypothetical protein